MGHARARWGWSTLGTELGKQSPEVSNDFQPLFHIHQTVVFLVCALPTP